LEENGVTRRYFAKCSDFYKVSPALSWWLSRHVRDYDLVHIHALFSFSSIAAAWAARRAGVPYVVRPLGTLGRYGIKQRRPWLKRLSLGVLEGPALRRAAAVHFTAEDEKREAEQTGIPMSGVVIPLGIDPLPAADGRLFRARFPSLGSARYLLYLSRLDRKKNVEGLLRAFSQCAAQWPGAILVIAGDGAPGYAAGLKALADDLGLKDRVVWAGHVDGDLKASALAGAELFVLPSFSENFGIAAAEALCRIDRPEAALAERVAALAHESFCVRLEAANVLDRIGEKAQPLRGAMKKAIEDQSHENMFVRCLLDHTLATLDE